MGLTRGSARRLFVVFTLGVAAATASVAGAQFPPAEAQGPPATFDRFFYVEISGAKTPERIPEYMVWRVSFVGLASMDDESLTDIFENLFLTPAERTAVLRAAKAHLEQDASCHTRQATVWDARRQAGASGPEMAAAIRDGLLICRQEVLDAADKVLLLLKPESQASLRMWVHEQRSNISVSVPKADLPYFNKPR